LATLRQLALKGRRQKRRRCIVAALKGAPQRKGVIMKIGTTTPKKPNSAKRKFAKVWVPFSKKIVYSHIPGMGRHFLQEYSNVLVEGGNPPDVPGINYTLVRGKKAYDFCIPEEHGRTRKRSKFGAFKVAVINKENVLVKYQEEKELIDKKRTKEMTRLNYAGRKRNRYRIFLLKKKVKKLVLENKRKVNAQITN